MSESGRFFVTVALTVLLFLAAAFVFHASPRFPGSLAGSMLGIAAAVLMVLLLVYPLVKYSPGLKARVTRLVSMRALLAFHTYAGIMGALLGVLHTGHKYQSPLGVALVVTMLIVIVTGFIGRYYLPRVAADLREQQSNLAILRSNFDRMTADLALRKAAVDALPATGPPASSMPVRQLVNAIADLENAILTHGAVKAVFVRWIIAHVVTSIVMYLLLTLHVAGEIYYGLRWLP